MDTHTRTIVVEAIVVWADRQNGTGAIPGIALGTLGEYSPSQLAEAVKAGSPAGELFLQIIENGLKRCSLGEILANFRGEKVPAAASGD
jgi:hypothetical protein